MTVFLMDFIYVLWKMTIRRIASRRYEEGRVNEEIPPQVENVYSVLHGTQNPIRGEGNEVLVVPRK